MRNRPHHSIASPFQAQLLAKRKAHLNGLRDKLLQQIRTGVAPELSVQLEHFKLAAEVRSGARW